MTTILGETTTTALDWAKLGTDFATNMTNILVNKGSNNSGTTTTTLPTTNVTPTGYAQPQKDNTLLYIGVGVLGIAVIYALMNTNNKRR